MGTFQVTIEVGNPIELHFERIEALVDTGATYLVVPRNVLTTLGVRPIERRPFTLADGRTVEYEVGVVSLRLQGRTFPVLCVFGDEGSEPLLGAVALETFLLAADPVGKRLVSVPGRLMNVKKAAKDLKPGDELTKMDVRLSNRRRCPVCGKENVCREHQYAYVVWARNWIIGLADGNENTLVEVADRL